MLYFCCVLLGASLVWVLISIFDSRKKVYGIIDVDEETGLCRVKITSNDLGDPRISTAMFKVNHGQKIDITDISRD